MAETEQKTKCKGCPGEFERIFGHLRYNQKCKKEYTPEEIEKLEETRKKNRQLTNAKQYEKIKIMVNNKLLYLLLFF